MLRNFFSESRFCFWQMTQQKIKEGRSSGKAPTCPQGRLLSEGSRIPALLSREEKELHPSEVAQQGDKSGFLRAGLRTLGKRSSVGSCPGNLTVAECCGQPQCTKLPQQSEPQHVERASPGREDLKGPATWLQWYNRKRRCLHFRLDLSFRRSS